MGYDLTRAKGHRSSHSYTPANRSVFEATATSSPNSCLNTNLNVTVSDSMFVFITSRGGRAPWSSWIKAPSRWCYTSIIKKFSVPYAVPDSVPASYYRPGFEDVAGSSHTETHRYTPDCRFWSMPEVVKFTLPSPSRNEGTKVSPLQTLPLRAKTRQPVKRACLAPQKGPRKTDGLIVTDVSGRKLTSCLPLLLRHSKIKINSTTGGLAARRLSVERVLLLK